MARTVYYKVHNQAIRSFMYNGQPVNRLLNEVLDDARDNAKKFAPVRTSALRKSIRVGRRARIDSAWGLSGAVYTNIKYGIFVEEGTTGPIYPLKANFLKIPKRDGPGFIFAESVKGQRAQNFMKRGLSLAIRQESRLSMRWSSGGFG